MLGVVLGACFGWYKFFREEPQPAWVTATPDMRFKYGSIGAEHDAGIPYWIFYVLPRMFPEKLPGPGGYAVARRAVGAGTGAAGRLHQEGDRLSARRQQLRGLPHGELPHCATNENPTFVTAGPGHTTNVEGFFRFLVDCAKDPRFNAGQHDARDQSGDGAVLGRPDASTASCSSPSRRSACSSAKRSSRGSIARTFPEWGRGRDDAMNLTKYFMIKVADGRQLRPDRHAVDLEPQEIQAGEGNYAQSGPATATMPTR